MAYPLSRLLNSDLRSFASCNSTERTENTEGCNIKRPLHRRPERREVGPYAAPPGDAGTMERSVGITLLDNKTQNSRCLVNAKVESTGETCGVLR